MSDLHVSALASWFGSNRLLAKHVGEQLRGCAWVGVGFAGGMCELAHIDARSLLVNDAHAHVINLARVTSHPVLGPKLYRRLRRTIYHPDILKYAQEKCLACERAMGQADLFGKPPMLEDVMDWAYCYFICAWMGRHGTAGTPAEFTGSIAMRYNANGGDNATHFHNMVKSLVAWRRILGRANFTMLDVFDFIETCCKDKLCHGLYFDPPFPGPGDAYTHKFDEAAHRRLAKRLDQFVLTKVVCRFYDHPLVREIYPEGRWSWLRLVGRKQTNDSAPEVLLVNAPAVAMEAA